MAGGVGFLSLIAACFVFARRFKAIGERTWARFSMVTGVVFFAAFAGISSGSTQTAVTLAFGIAVVIAWAWISSMAARLRKGLPA